MSAPHTPTPEHLHVVAYRDPRVEARGHRPGSPYIEAVYVGILGPTASWLWQRLARTAAVASVTELDTLELAASLGLGQDLGANAPLTRTINRLQHFDAARRHDDTLAVRLALPDLAPRRLARLSPSARLAHHHLTANRPAAPEAPAPDQVISL